MKSHRQNQTTGIYEKNETRPVAMEQVDKIEGGERLKIFERLRQDKTVMTLRLLGRNYERLTIVIGLGYLKKTPHFVIDSPSDFKAAVEGLPDWRIRFEFTSPDRISYAFKTSGGIILQDGIWIEFPDSIERRQRRRYFRLAPPLGTKINFDLNSIAYEANVIDIGLGGALVSLEMDKWQDFGLKEGRSIDRVRVVFPSKDGAPSIQVEGAMVKRLEKDPAVDRYQCAFQFALKKEDEKTLKDLIYTFQREFLRKRQNMDRQPNRHPSVVSIHK
jgi:c-di-GMP-binding flagellar brake protein YcgR